MASLPELYNSGASIPDIARQIGWPQSRVRRFLLNRGVHLRARADAVKLAASQGKLGYPGAKRQFTVLHCRNISEAKRKLADKTARGVSVKASGYVEYTRGEHKGHSIHVVAMEAMIGRRIKRGEVVHHIDGNESNNAVANLALMTKAEHSRLHALTKIHKRDEKGRFK